MSVNFGFGSIDILRIVIKHVDTQGVADVVRNAKVAFVDFNFKMIKKIVNTSVMGFDILFVNTVVFA